MKRGKSKWLRMLVFVVLATGLMWARDWWERRESRVADAVEAFAREGAGDEKLAVKVTVYAIDSLRNEMPGEADLEIGEFYGRVTPEHFHQYPIQKVRAVDDPAEARRVVEAVVRGIRRKAAGAKCFEPHHALRITRGAQHVDVVICYSCNQVEVWGIDPEGNWERSVYDTTSDGSRKAVERGGIVNYEL